MKKVTLIFVVVILLVALFAGCAGSSSQVLDSHKPVPHSTTNIEDEKIYGLAGVLITNPTTYIILYHRYNFDKDTLGQRIIHLRDDLGHVDYKLDASKKEGAYVELSNGYEEEVNGKSVKVFGSITFHLDSLKRIGGIELPINMDIGRPKIAK
jgi:hypothetical protein